MLTSAVLARPTGGEPAGLLAGIAGGDGELAGSCAECADTVLKMFVSLGPLELTSTVGLQGFAPGYNKDALL